MVDNFGIAIGWDNTGGVADFVNYQPLTPGIQYARSTPTPEDVVNEGPHVVFTWGRLSEVQFQALMTQSGLIAARVSRVTIKAQDENYFWVFWNGRAFRPKLTRRGFFMNDVPLLIRDLQLIG
jgi:hypothetical protein